MSKQLVYLPSFFLLVHTHTYIYSLMATPVCLWLTAPSALLITLTHQPKRHPLTPFRPPQYASSRRLSPPEAPVIPRPAVSVATWDLTPRRLNRPTARPRLGRHGCYTNCGRARHVFLSRILSRVGPHHTGISDFTYIAVLGRGHFGKVRIVLCTCKNFSTFPAQFIRK